MHTDPKSLPEICAYCGVNAELTREHVIPRSFEAENAKNWDPIIVWACKTCNNAKSRLDAKVRELFAVDIVGGNHETAQKLMEGKIKRSVERSARLGHKNSLTELFKQMEPTTITSADGKSSMVGMGAKLKEDFFTPWFTLVVKGLSMALSHQRFTSDANFKVSRYYPDAFETIKKVLRDSNAPEPIELGTHTKFIYRSVAELPHGFGMWLFEFYGGVVFDVTVLPEDVAKQFEDDLKSQTAKVDELPN